MRPVHAIWRRLVLAVQMLRLFAVMLAGSLLGRWWSS
jgi:uncharacterized membrane protein AbrB (regulator of aidB expression)